MMKGSLIKTLKRLFVLSIITGLVLILPVKTQAAKTSGKCGDSVFWLFNLSNHTLTITGSGKMYDYDHKNQAPWWEMAETEDEDINYNWNEIEKVIIGSGITYIGEDAFDSLNLREVEFYDSSSSKLEEIGSDAFCECETLESIDLPSSCKKIGEHAFAMAGLTSFKIPSSCTTIGKYAFAGCKFPRIEISNTVKTVGKYAFGYYASGWDDEYILDDDTPERDTCKVDGFCVVGPKSKITSSTAYKYAKKNKLDYVMKGVKGPKIKSAKNVKTRRIQLKWKKTGSASGYQIRYSMSKNFDIFENKYINIKGKKTTTRKTAKLKKKKTYYITVRYYKTVKGKKCYSEWTTPAKKVKIRK